MNIFNNNNIDINQKEANNEKSIQSNRFATDKCIRKIKKDALCPQPLIQVDIIAVKMGREVRETEQ